MRRFIEVHDRQAVGTGDDDRRLLAIDAIAEVWPHADGAEIYFRYLDSTGEQDCRPVCESYDEIKALLEAAEG